MTTTKKNVADLMAAATSLAEGVKPAKPDEDEPKLSVGLSRRMLEGLVTELRKMETVDAYNDQLREWAEDLVEAFDAITAAFDEIHNRMVDIRGRVPEVYAHLYLTPRHKQ